MKGRIVSINISEAKGVRKSPVEQCALLQGHGIIGDAHAGTEKQVSLLALESIEHAESQGLELNPGDFGENLTTSGIDWENVPVGTRFRLGAGAVVQISEKGKTCHTPCEIGRRLGECIMPREGVFARVVLPGEVRPLDEIALTDVKVGAVLTSSDRCASGERGDQSGPALVELLRDMGLAIVDYRVLPDEEALLAEHLRFLADRCSPDLVLTTGGTGFSVRDRMPEATQSVLTSQAPGIAEAIRHEGLNYTPFACISRGVSGLRNRTLIVNLPGSAKAISQTSEFLRAALPHALEALRMEVKDCGTIVERAPAAQPAL